VIDRAANAANVGWEIAQAVGLAAAVGCALLCLLPVRPRAPGRATLSLRLHEWAGWLALAGAIAHVALLLVVDHRVVEHLKPGAPLYEWAGILGLALLILLTVPATDRLRRRLWSHHRSFQALHVALATAMDQTCIVDDSHHVMCTGRNAMGQLGSDPGEAHAPVRTDARSDWTAIASGDSHACGIAGGTTTCWGLNSEGELGDGDQFDQEAPVVSGGGTYARIAAGPSTSIGIAASSTSVSTK